MRGKNLILCLALAGVLPFAGCNNGPTDPIVEKIAVESVTLNKSEVELRVTGKVTLVATVSPDNATDKTVTWSVAPEGIATVKDGVVTAVAVGHCVVTAKAGEKSTTCNVTVSAEPAIDVTSVTLNKTALELELDSTELLTATVLPSDATDPTVTWRSNNPEYVTVSDAGLVTAKKVTASPIKVTAKAGTKEADCYVTVKDYPVNHYYMLSEANDNANIALYKNNTKEGQTSYIGTIEKLTVGDDNAFQMKPELKVYNIQTVQQADPAVWTYPFEGKIEELDNGNYVAAKDTYAAFDSTNCTFKFNEKAIGKTLRLSVNPTGLIDGQKVADFVTSVEVNVIDGFNVYNDKELAYFNDPNATQRWINSNEFAHVKSLAEQNAAWKAFRKANGLDENYVPANILLQSNINITKDSMPSLYFFDASDTGLPLGRMRDTTEVYFRENSNFIFNGNYFNIDTTNLPTAGDVVAGWDNISHSTLFKYVGSAAGSNAVFKNCSYFGNSPRGNDADTYKGGLIFFKFESAMTDNTQSTALFNNFNVERACISFFAEGHVKVDVKDSIVKEGFSNAIYIYHRGDVNIDHCQFTSFGGPVIVTNTDSEDYVNYCPVIKVTENSKLESMCTGQEPWFVSVGAAGLIDSVLEPNAFFTPFGKTFVKSVEGKKMFNAIYVGQAPGGSRMGSITFGNSSKLGLDYESEQSDISKVLIVDGIQAQFGQSAVFKTSAGGFAYGFAHPLYESGKQCLTNFIPQNPANALEEIGAAIMGGTFPDLSLPEAYANEIYQGDYLNFFTKAPDPIGGLSLVLGYYSIAE